MTRHVVTSNDAATIEAAIKTLFERYVGAIVVTDDGGRCKGIFTERDAIRIVAGDVSQDIPLENVMTKNPITIRDGVPFTEAMDLMVTNRIRHLPVVNDDKQLVGLLSIKNLMDEVVGFTRTKA